jgi:hypothetical protein
MSPKRKRGTTYEPEAQAREIFGNRQECHPESYAALKDRLRVAK